MIAYHSLQFAVFFFAVFVLYYAIPKKAQWWLLLAASVYFYWTASGALILWLLVSAGAVWIAGLGLERIAMRRFKIADLRLIFENDVRFLEQF